jgi:predicted O-methyltransferase YrrM
MNTGWKNWDRHLSHLPGKKLKVLEIGVYKGGASVWILDNLFTDADSMLYAVDIFANSEKNEQEYVGVDFKDIKDEFMSNIKKTGKAKNVKVIQEYSHNALANLILDEAEVSSFDLIYIDASHDAIDVMTDACLAWKLLKPEGIMIFDDYRWDIFVQEFFRPKLAIDAFLGIFKSELLILQIERQAFVKKRAPSAFLKPVKNTKSRVKI